MDLSVVDPPELVEFFFFAEGALLQICRPSIT